MVCVSWASSVPVFSWLNLPSLVAREASSRLGSDAISGATRIHPGAALSAPSPAGQVVIVGGPEEEDELLAIVVDDGEAIPLFDSTEEAADFLGSTGDFGEGWRPLEVSAERLVELLEYQGEEVEYVAISPPPERLEGGMEIQVLYREILIDLLKRRTTPEPQRGFLKRIFGR